MEVPEGYDFGQNKVCLLKKSLYGLKQAPHEWSLHFRNFLIEQNLCPTEFEPCIFYNENHSLFLAIFVDDGYAIGKEEIEINSMLANLKSGFEMTEYDDPDSFTNLNFVRTDNLLFVHQKDYVEETLEQFNMLSSNPVDTPIVINAVPSQESKSFPYREAVVKLLYLANKTRPDVSFALNYESRFLDKFDNAHVGYVKRTLKYLNGTKEFGLCYHGDRNDDELIAFCDADYANDPMDRKSVTGFVIYYKGGPVSWMSKKQPVVALSTTEAEFIAAKK